MPGSNDYSMAPELRADYTATEAQPTLIAKPKATSATLPQIYVTQAYNPETFDQAAFDAAYLKDKHGTDASKRDIRRFNNEQPIDEDNTVVVKNKVRKMFRAKNKKD